MIEANIYVMSVHYQRALDVPVLLVSWGYGTPGNVQSSVTRDPSASYECRAQRTQTFRSVAQP